MLHYSLNGNNMFVIPVGASAVAADGCKYLFRFDWLQFVCLQSFNTAALMLSNQVKS